LKTDVYTSLGVAAGLIMWLADLIFLAGIITTLRRPLIALGVAILILKESYMLLTVPMPPLLDTSLSDEEIKTITDVIASHSVRFIILKQGIRSVQVCRPAS